MPTAVLHYGAVPLHSHAIRDGFYVYHGPTLNSKSTSRPIYATHLSDDSLFE